MLNTHNNINVIKTAKDVEKGGALLSVEGGNALCGRLSALRMLYKLGVRSLTLTWNGRNELGVGASEGEDAAGLTDVGKNVVSLMNKLGMIVDVSHLSEKGFWDVAKTSDKAFIASHSNAKKLCGHWRNLTDEQIKEIIKRNGFIGINFCSDFLREGGSKISDIMRHIEHILSFGGENVVGFGGDFDGVDDLPEGIFGVQDMEKIINELLKQNYHETVINNILYGNLDRTLKLILKN